eukprot:COSAG01_NODE_13109_length_1634_cov_1.161564_1_plen_59_part_10
MVTYCVILGRVPRQNAVASEVRSAGGARSGEERLSTRCRVSGCCVLYTVHEAIVIAGTS